MMLIFCLFMHEVSDLDSYLVGVDCKGRGMLNVMDEMLDFLVGLFEIM